MELGNLLYILICFFVPAIYLPTTDFIGIGDADLRINFVSPTVSEVWKNLSLNFGVALLFFACNSFCPQSVNRAKNQNSGQNLKTDTASFGIFEAVFWEVENISASKTSSNKPSHI